MGRSKDQGVTACADGAALRTTTRPIEHRLECGAARRRGRAPETAADSLGYSGLPNYVQREQGKTKSAHYWSLDAQCV